MRYRDLLPVVYYRLIAVQAVVSNSQQPQPSHVRYAESKVENERDLFDSSCSEMVSVSESTSLRVSELGRAVPARFSRTIQQLRTVPHARWLPRVIKCNQGTECSELPTFSSLYYCHHYPLVPYVCPYNVVRSLISAGLCLTLPTSLLYFRVLSSRFPNTAAAAAWSEAVSCFALKFIN